MTDDTGEQLSESPEDILSRLSPEAAAEITIIGGQALSVWGDQYLLEELTGEEYIHLASPKRLIQVRQYLGIAKDDETRVPGC